jgi:predicted RNase H-like HicB family nuclease
LKVWNLIKEYIAAALERAVYKLIEGEEPFYAEVPELEGVWASGSTPEECRQNLSEVIEGWLAVRNARCLPIPPVGGCIPGFPKTFQQGKYTRVVAIPNPYCDDRGDALLTRVLSKTSITIDEWMTSDISLLETPL